jgi:hypothetical protein
MRKTLLASLAAAALLSGGTLSNRAEAMALAAPSTLSAADTGLVQKAALLCGYYGCVRRYRPYYGGGYYGRHYAYYGRGYYGRRW